MWFLAPELPGESHWSLLDGREFLGLRIGGLMSLGGGWCVRCRLARAFSQTGPEEAVRSGRACPRSWVVFPRCGPIIAHGVTHSY